jgi:hypothetical protein
LARQFRLIPERLPIAGAGEINLQISKLTRTASAMTNAWLPELLTTTFSVPLAMWTVPRLRKWTPPCVYVFNRQGKWKRFYDPVNYEEVEKTVEQFVKEKSPP